MARQPVVFGTVAILLGVSVGLGAGEVGLRLLGMRYATAPVRSDPYLHHVHPANYSYQVRDPRGEYGGHIITFDHDGAIVASDSFTISEEQPVCRIAFMGDSFTEAIQVPADQSYAGLIADRLRGRAIVRNYGVSSYSPMLYLVQWNRLVASFRPTHVVLQLYSNDVRDDVEYAGSARFDSAGHLVAVAGPPSHWAVELIRHSFVFRYARTVYHVLRWRMDQRDSADPSVGGYIEENPATLEPTASYVAQLAQAVRESGATFVLTVVPSKYNLSLSGEQTHRAEFSDKWRTWSERRGIAFLDLVKPFRAAVTQGQKVFFDLDIHFTPAGHRTVAEALLQGVPSLAECGAKRSRQPGPRTTM
jgi:lysophospholipase L1-like esterase